MTETNAIARASAPATVTSLTRDLRALGMRPGMTVLVHASLSALGYVVSGAHSVILALEAAVGETGTLMMPAHSAELSDPAEWQHPPVPAAWWDVIRAEMPAFDPALTATRDMGVIAEAFRRQPGAQRSQHPKLSFAARGRHAERLTADHPLAYGLGEGSPLARLYDLDGWVLLLGVGYGNNTSLHLAEARAALANRRSRLEGSPLLVDGVRQWVTYADWDWDESDFEALGAAFAQETGAEHRGPVGAGLARLMPQRPLVDFGRAWLERNR